jgi:hypothetical protein
MADMPCVICKTPTYVRPFENPICVECMQFVMLLPNKYKKICPICGNSVGIGEDCFLYRKEKTDPWLVLHFFCDEKKYTLNV